MQQMLGTWILKLLKEYYPSQQARILAFSPYKSLYFSIKPFKNGSI
jgi:hypothetical protein